MNKNIDSQLLVKRTMYEMLSDAHVKRTEGVTTDEQAIRLVYHIAKNHIDVRYRNEYYVPVQCKSSGQILVQGQPKVHCVSYKQAIAKVENDLNSNWKIYN